MNKFKMIFASIISTFFMVQSAFAAFLPTDFSLDTSEITVIGGIVVTGLASLWALRKIVKTVNRT